MQAMRSRPYSASDDGALRGDGGGGTSGGVTEDWKASVDRQLDQLHKDVRALLRWGVAAVVALAFMIAGLYERTNSRFDAVTTRIGGMEVQQAHISDKLDQLLERTPPKK